MSTERVNHLSARVDYLIKVSLQTHKGKLLFFYLKLLNDSILYFDSMVLRGN